MASIVGFVTRQQAGLVAPRSVSRNITPQHGGVTTHWAGGAQKATTHARCIDLWRGYQRFHMNNNYADVAYTGAVCQHGYAFAGRGAGVRTGANGTNTANQNWYAIVWIGGSGETPTQAAINAMGWWINTLRKAGAARRVVPHSFHKSTSCSGPDWTRISGQWNNKDISATTPAGGEEQMLKRGDKGHGVNRIQRALLAWKSDSLPQFGADSDFGGETEDAVKAYQAAAQIQQTGTVDGLTSSFLLEYLPDHAGGGGTGTQGPKGDKGDKGDAGPRGAKGDKGDPGPSPKSVTFQY